MDSVKRAKRLSESIEKRRMSLLSKNVFDLDSSARVAYMHYMVVLASRIASMASGVGSDQVSFFVRVFGFRELTIPEARALFIAAQADTTPTSHYIDLLKKIISVKSGSLEDTIDGLFCFASFDKVISVPQIKFLKELSLYLGLDRVKFRSILRSHTITNFKTPYEMLGVRKDSSLDEIKIAYRSAVRECHPDNFIKLGAPDELLEVIRERFDNVNKAYEFLKSKVK